MNLVEVPTVDLGFRVLTFCSIGNGRRDAIDKIDIRFVHPSQELTGVGR
jgi:hypothetical protein